MSNQWYETKMFSWIDPDDTTGIASDPDDLETIRFFALLEKDGWEDDPSAANAGGWVYVRRPYTPEQRVADLKAAQERIAGDLQELRAMINPDRYDPMHVGRPGTESGEPISELIDYEAGGAPWTLTINGGKR